MLFTFSDLKKTLRITWEDDLCLLTAHGFIIDKTLKLFPETNITYLVTDDYEQIIILKRERLGYKKFVIELRIYLDFWTIVAKIEPKWPHKKINGNIPVYGIDDLSAFDLVPFEGDVGPTATGQITSVSVTYNKYRFEILGDGTHFFFSVPLSRFMFYSFKREINFCTLFQSILQVKFIFSKKPKNVYLKTEEIKKPVGVFNNRFIKASDEKDTFFLTFVRAVPLGSEPIITEARLIEAFGECLDEGFRF